MNPKFWGMLGLAMRAGKIAIGEGKAEDISRGGGAELLILATDASANTEKKFLNMASFHKLQIIRPGDRMEICEVLGRPAVVMAVTDQGFAKQLIRLFEDDGI